MSLLRVALCVLACAYAVRGNTYLHNPRGSNNRLNEPSLTTLNNFRMFHAVNNEEGGYCWGPAMSYVEGSVLPIEWTSLLECGTDSSCTQILQYMCTDTKGSDDIIRDGQTTQSISTISNSTDPNYYNVMSGGDYKYGLHESFNYFKECSTRSRNKGLFTADQSVSNGMGGMATRQNAGGQRSGFECQEERDYYPYWHPSPWKDIAIITSDISTCDFYQAESQNVKGKGHCTKASGFATSNNPTDCATEGGNWTVEPSFGLPAPDCKKATYSSIYEADTYSGTYVWRLPTAATEPCVITNSCNCVMRVRFNMTSNNATGLTGKFLDSTNSAANYINPTNTLEYNEIGNFTLTYNTNQDGRTFQDRSFMFHISPAPTEIPATSTIYNLNIRGKRGNNVQIFPAMQYGFTPAELVVGVGDYVHFQWTGCDFYPSSPTRLDGNGMNNDRSNIVQISDLKSNTPLYSTADYQSVTPLFDTPTLRSYMALLGQTNCSSNISTSLLDTSPTNCALLNAAGPYFDGGILRMNNSGVFTYMSTRNNYFSNRSQKGTIYVGVTPPTPSPSPSSTSSPSTISPTPAPSSAPTTKGANNNSAGKETIALAHFLVLLCISLFL